MIEPDTCVGVDLRSPTLRVAVRSEQGKVTVTSVPTAAAWVDGAVLVGQPAATALASEPEAGWNDLLDRVGDPVPCRLGEAAATASDLVASAIAEAVGPTTDLRLIVPAWGGARRDALAASLVKVGLPGPRWIDELDALATDPQGAGVDRLLLLSTSAGLTRARVLDASEQGWRPVASADVDFGTDDVVQATLSRVEQRVAEASDRELTAAERRTLSGICAPAVERLPKAQRLDVALPGLTAVRVTRAELFDAIRPAASVAFAGLAATLAASGIDDLPARIVLEGPGSRLRGLVDGICEALGRDVTVAEEAAESVLAPAFGLPAPPLDAPDPALDPAAGASASEDETEQFPVVGASEQALGAEEPPLGAHESADAPEATVDTQTLEGQAAESDSAAAYGWSATPEAVPGDRRGLKLVGAGVGLLALLAAIAAFAVPGIVRSLQGAVQSAGPAAIPVSTPSKTATPTLTFTPEASASGSPSVTPSSSPGPSATSSSAPGTTSTTSRSTTTSGGTTTRATTTKTTTTSTMTSTSTTATTSTTSTTSTTTTTTTTPPPPTDTTTPTPTDTPPPTAP